MFVTGHYFGSFQSFISVHLKKSDYNSIIISEYVLQRRDSWFCNMDMHTLGCLLEFSWPWNNTVIAAHGKLLCTSAVVNLGFKRKPQNTCAFSVVVLCTYHCCLVIALEPSVLILIFQLSHFHSWKMASLCFPATELVFQY